MQSKLSRTGGERTEKTAPAEPQSIRSHAHRLSARDQNAIVCETAGRPMVTDSDFGDRGCRKRERLRRTRVQVLIGIVACGSLCADLILGAGKDQQRGL